MVRPLALRFSAVMRTLPRIIRAREDMKKDKVNANTLSSPISNQELSLKGTFKTVYANENSATKVTVPHR